MSGSAVHAICMDFLKLHLQSEWMLLANWISGSATIPMAKEAESHVHKHASVIKRVEQGQH